MPRCVSVTDRCIELPRSLSFHELQSLKMCSSGIISSDCVLGEACCMCLLALCFQMGTAGCLSFHRMAQCVVHALKSLACRAPVTPASSPASHCKQRSALTPLRSTRAAAPVLLAHAEVTENIKYFSMGPKLRYPTVLHACVGFVISDGFLSKRPHRLLIVKLRCWKPLMSTSTPLKGQ